MKNFKKPKNLKERKKSIQKFKNTNKRKNFKSKDKVLKKKMKIRHQRIKIQKIKQKIRIAFLRRSLFKNLLKKKEEKLKKISKKRYKMRLF